MRNVLVSVVVLALGGCATTLAPSAASSESDELADIFLNGGRMRGAQLQARIAEALKHPLGSIENPVRVNMPPGQHAFLARLRCSDGKAPQFGRVGNFGPGIYNSIIDGYDVRCLTGAPAQSMIYMDMYHPEHNETAAPAGFTIVPAGRGGDGRTAAADMVLTG